MVITYRMRDFDEVPGRGVMIRHFVHGWCERIGVCAPRPYAIHYGLAPHCANLLLAIIRHISRRAAERISFKKPNIYGAISRQVGARHISRSFHIDGQG